MPIKEQAIELIRTLPDDCTLEDIQYHLYVRAKVDELVKSRKCPYFVIPTKVGIQSFQRVAKPLDSRFHGNDDFLRGHQS